MLLSLRSAGIQPEPIQTGATHKMTVGLYLARLNIMMKA